MSTSDGRLDLDSLTSLHWIGINLALISAVVHLVLGVGFLPHPMGVLFLLATGGFLGAIVLLVVGYRRRLLYLVGIPFTGIQIVGWYVVNRPAGPADIGPAGAIDKLAQLLLIVVLVMLYRWDW
ncbi:MAG: hypothetical protein R6V31_03205 [Halohasta sp.]